MTDLLARLMTVSRALKRNDEGGTDGRAEPDSSLPGIVDFTSDMSQTHAVSPPLYRIGDLVKVFSQRPASSSGLHSAHPRHLPPPVSAAGAAKPLRYCSFCGRDEDAVAGLVAGPACFICEGCVIACCEVLADESRGTPSATFAGQIAALKTAGGCGGELGPDEPDDSVRHG